MNNTETVSPAPAFTPLAGESDRAFEAFRVYFELGPRRRFLTVGRKVGAGLRTIQRWASDFDWRGRLQAHAVRRVDDYVQTENAVQREVLLDAAARAQAFRDRQYVLAEAILDVAERHLEHADEIDLDRLSFTDTCRALDFASRLVKQASETGTTATPDYSLRDQLTTLLDQVYGKTPAPTDTAAGPAPAASGSTAV